MLSEINFNKGDTFKRIISFLHMCSRAAYMIRLGTTIRAMRAMDG